MLPSRTLADAALIESVRNSCRRSRLSLRSLNPSINARKCPASASWWARARLSSRCPRPVKACCMKTAGPVNAAVQMSTAGETNARLRKQPSTTVKLMKRSGKPESAAVSTETSSVKIASSSPGSCPSKRFSGKARIRPQRCRTRRAIDPCATRIKATCATTLATTVTRQSVRKAGASRVAGGASGRNAEMTNAIKPTPPSPPTSPAATARANDPREDLSRKRTSCLIGHPRPISRSRPAVSQREARPRAL